MTTTFRLFLSLVTNPLMSSSLMPVLIRCGTRIMRSPRSDAVLGVTGLARDAGSAPKSVTKRHHPRGWPSCRSVASPERSLAPHR